MFEACVVAPVDPILGLTEAYKQDTNPLKSTLVWVCIKMKRVSRLFYKQ